MKKLTTPILIVDAPERNADLRHASGFWAPDPVVFLITSRRSYLFVSALEAGRARQLAAEHPEKAMTVLTPDDVQLTGARRRQLGEWTAALLQREGVRRVQVPTSFPIGIAQRLARHRVTVQVAEEALFPERELKTAGELARIAESQRAAVAAMRAAIRCLRAAPVSAGGYLGHGRRRLCAEDVKQVIQLELLRRGTLCRDVIVAPGEQGVDPHERGHGPIRAGETIVLDIFPQHLAHGYWGDLTRTVVRGRASPALRQMYAAVKAAQAAALRLIKAGVACQRVHAVVQEEFVRRGYDTREVDGRPQGFIHSTGHGLGLEIHEAPGLAPGTALLRRGQVVTVEPGLYYPMLGAVRIEDTVHVTARGWDVIARCPHVFEI
ncbi:MAG: M24 family metallopeptidase [Lentisphaerae bacterium]|nr:M24 family metallopeptidase [Lentisphaerota bacterium]